jgi:hypothetical protein
MKTFIYNVPSYSTGGVECLYHLCDSINNNGGEAYIKHVGEEFGSHLIPDRYKHLNVKLTREIEDSPENNLVLAEIFTGDLDKFYNIKKFVWWLSVDNNNKHFNNFKDENITHLFQSYYAQDFLLKNKAYKTLPLFDFINLPEQDFNLNEKEDVICYNPNKGMEYTREIIKRCPDLDFVPLVNMTTKEIYQTLAKSKVYMDLGNHPGRDKIPREAAINGCVVVTGMRGSAKFYSDVPIPNQYKLTQIDNTIQDYLRDVTNNFYNYLNDFNLYRKIIKKQKEEFTNQCKIFI